jgi:hypothetical protein
MTGTEEMTQSVRAHHRLSRRNLSAELGSGFRRSRAGHRLPVALSVSSRWCDTQKRPRLTSGATGRGGPERELKGNLPRGMPSLAVTLGA